MSSSSHTATGSTIVHTPPCVKRGEVAKNLLKSRMELDPDPGEYALYKFYVKEILSKSFGSGHIDVEDGKDDSGRRLYVNIISPCRRHKGMKCVSDHSQTYSEDRFPSRVDPELKELVEEDLGKALARHGLRLEK